MRNPFSALFERRSIATSHDLLQYLLSGNKSVSGATVTEMTALNVAAVRTGVEIRAELFATLPFDVIERAPGSRTSTQQPTHWLARLLAKPNSFQTGSEFRGMLEAHRLLRGNGYAWINWQREPVRDGQVIATELVPLHPDKLTITEPEVLGAPTKYTLQRATAPELPIPEHEIFHVKGGLITNGRTGRSFLADMREVIGGALSTQDHANSLWSRDATPTVVLKHPGDLSPEAKKGLEESWEALYGPGKDKRRVAVIEEGMAIERLSLTPNDGQFLETQQDLRAQIAASLRVPPFMMGLAEKATSWGSGIEQQQIGLLVFTTTPTATIWEERIHRDLLNGSPTIRGKFNVYARVRGDLRSQGQFFWWMRQMGAMSANDIRAMFDWNPIEGGDEYLQPTTLAPLGSDPFAERGTEA